MSSSDVENADAEATRLLALADAAALEGVFGEIGLEIPETARGKENRLKSN